MKSNNIFIISFLTALLTVPTALATIPADTTSPESTTGKATKTGAHAPTVSSPNNETEIAAETLPKPLPLPKTEYAGRNLRSEVMSYTIRRTATAGDRNAEWNYLPLSDFSVRHTPAGEIYSTDVEFPEFWADRIVILHTEGGRNSHTVTFNGQTEGSSRDSGIPSEIELRNGTPRSTNYIEIGIPADTREPESAIDDDRQPLSDCFLYSQPRTRIWDYEVSATTEGDDGRLVVDVIVENDYSTPETFGVCFDIFSPDGKVEEYGIREITAAPKSRDTVRLTATIYGAGKRRWSARNPQTYTLTLFIRHGGRILEYVPVNIGFGSTEYRDGNIYRNGEPVEIRYAEYASTTPEALRKDIKRLKQEGFNTLWPQRPQPYWFYDICDRMGMYVVDQANINTDYRTDDPRIGGALSNDPAWLGEYLARIEGMYMRTRNHPCIIAWSTGGDSGNGYNMYKAYMWLKKKDPDRAVLYRAADGQWNNDIKL